MNPIVLLASALAVAFADTAIGGQWGLRRSRAVILSAALVSLLGVLAFGVPGLVLAVVWLGYRTLSWDLSEIVKGRVFLPFACIDPKNKVALIQTAIRHSLPAVAALVLLKPELLAFGAIYAGIATGLGYAYGRFPTLNYAYIEGARGATYGLLLALFLR